LENNRRKGVRGRPLRRSQELKPRLREYIRGIVRDEDGELLEFDDVAVHVHLQPGTGVTPLAAGANRWISD
jgi:hypothetical protein